MNYGSVCSGIEAASVAWHPLGWRASFLSEIEPFPRAVLAHHYPTVPLHGDFTTIGARDYEPIDLLVGGTPCQSFSVAGLRGGLADDRGNLALEFLRLAQRLGPRWLVWENVPGVLSSSGGRDFGAILEGMVELGYGFAYRVLDAQFFGVPQRRRRVFVVGYLGDWRPAAAVLFERESLSGNPPPRREAGKGFAAATAPSLTASGRGVERTGETRGQDPVVAIPILEAGARTGKSTDDIRACIGIAEQGDPMFTLQSGKQHAIAFGGNNQRGPIDVATAVNAHGGPHGRQDFETETFIAHALRAEGFDASEDGTGRGTPLVPVPIAFDCKAGGNTTFSIGDMPGALRGEGHGGGHAAIAFSCKDHGADAGAVSPTLRSMGHDGSHANAGGQVAVAVDVWNQTVDGDIAATLNAESGAANHSGPKILHPMAVRRLTPRECERLQGFPDDYTAVTYRGKPAADGPRYKALGNSMAVPVMRWIGERIKMAEDL